MDRLIAASSVSLDAYQIRGLDDVLTPALAVYANVVDANVRAILRVLGGDPNRWRPHVKTAKLEFIMQGLVEAGVVDFKCATTLERSEEHTSELQSRLHLVCRLLLEKKKKRKEAVRDNEMKTEH